MTDLREEGRISPKSLHGMSSHVAMSYVFTTPGCV